MFDMFTAKIFGGLALALFLTNITSCAVQGRKIDKAEKALAASVAANQRLEAKNAILKGNNSTLEAGLSQCNAGVENAAKVANAVSSAGVRALQEVQKAGKSVDRKVREIDAMPKETCEDAFKILKNS